MLQNQETNLAQWVEGPLLEIAHRDRISEAAPALRDEGLRDRLAATPRVAGRLDALLAARLNVASRRPEDRSATARGLEFLDAEPAVIERRLVFLGAVSYGPALRRTVLREEVAVLVEAIGARTLRVALAHAALGGDRLGLELENAEKALFCFEQRAAEHFAAWIDSLPEPYAARARLRLAPSSPVAPARAAYGDATLIPALAPIVGELDKELGR